MSYDAFRSSTISRSCVFFALLLSLVSLQHGYAQYRQTHDIAVFAAAGVATGARVGASVFMLRHASMEASVGYMNIQLIQEGGRKENTGGISVGAGMNWYSHGDDDISPFVSLLASWVKADASRIEHSRFVLIATVGTDYHLASSMSVFFRFGPAVQFTTTRKRTETETVTQFDAGIAYRL